MTRRGAWWLGVGLALGGVGGVFLWRTVLSRSSMGQVDPVGATIGGAGFVLGVLTLVLAIRTEHRAEPDVTALARRLALDVREAEGTARAQLLRDHDTIDVGFTLRPARHDAGGAARTGKLTEVVDYFSKLDPCRLIITGAPGSGKTVAAIQLILGLIADPDAAKPDPLRAAPAPVPVRMSATSLDPDLSVTDWLAAHLRERHRMSKRNARALVMSRAVLPVIDGLDEMSEEAKPGYSSPAAKVLRSCNEYLEGTKKSALILTCRSDQYTSLTDAGARLAEAAHVELKPVGLTAAKEFIDHSVDDGERWEPIIKVLRRGGNKELAEALSTPWRLALATVVYEQRDPASGKHLREPAELVDPKLDTEAKIRDHLLDRYIPAVVARNGGGTGSPVDGPGYSEKRTRSWLTTLARHLDADASSDVLLDELWPIAGRIRARMIVLGTALLFAAVFIAGGRTSSVFGSVIAIAAAAMLLLRTWPRPMHFDFLRLRVLAYSPKARKSVAEWFLGSLIATVGGRIVYGDPFDPSAVIITTLIVGCFFGLGSLIFVPVPNSARATPADRVRIGIILWSVFMTLVTGYGVTVVLRLVERSHHPVVGLVLATVLALAMMAALGIAVATVITLAFAPRSVFYLTLLACTRRWSKNPLPWRLNRFLAWSSEAGLMRTAGTCYQFRHKELQDYLARS